MYAGGEVGCDGHCFRYLLISKMVEWSGIRTSGTDLDVVTKHITIIGGNKNIPLLCVPWRPIACPTSNRRVYCCLFKLDSGCLAFKS